MTTDTTESAAVDTTTTATDTAATANTDSTTATESTAGEGQGDAGKTADTEADTGKTGEAEEQAEQQGAPEAYEAFAVPEGFTLEGDRLDKAAALFKELNLPQSAAQKAIDTFVQMASEDASNLEAAVNQQIETWGKQSRDTFGDQYDATVADARTAITAVKSEGLTEAFEKHGWGNHPELIRAFAHFGKIISDGQMTGIGGDAPAAGQPKGLAERMYPNMK